MSQQAAVSGLCEKFHLYRLEKLVAVSKFLGSYCSRIMGGGQDNPAGLTSPPGGKINQPGYVAPGGEDNQGGGRISRDRLPPRGATYPWLACPPGGQPVQGAR